MHIFRLVAVPDDEEEDVKDEDVEDEEDDEEEDEEEDEEAEDRGLVAEEKDVGSSASC